MWRKLIVAGTIVVAVVVGSAFAVASQSVAGTSPALEGTQADHWSEMEVEMGDAWQEMVGHMQDVLGDEFPDMVNHMESFSFDMGRSDAGVARGGMHG